MKTKIKLYPQAHITLVDGNRLPFIPSHNLYPVGTVAQATTRTGEKSFIKLLAPHSKTPLGYLYNYEPVKTLVFNAPVPVQAGEKMRYNNTPYEVLSVTFVPSDYDSSNKLRPARYIIEVSDIVAMLEPVENNI